MHYQIMSNNSNLLIYLSFLFKYVPKQQVLRITEINMVNDKKVVVVMPAYNAAHTLRRTYDEVVAQIVWLDYTIAEVSCPTKYFPEASSINLLRSIKYGFGCLFTALEFRMARMKLISSNLFPDLKSKLRF